MTVKPATTGRQIWLDGLRGIAAAIVAWFHFTVGALEVLYRSFWDEPAEQNRRLVQLPPFRLLIAGQAMVNLFFVISGYSVSIAIIRLRDGEPGHLFYRKLTSAVVRRGLRLYLPVVAIYTISHLLFFVGLYAWKFPDLGACTGVEPWSNPLPHLRCFLMSNLTTLNLAGIYSVWGLNDHLWTIPLEFQGSMVLYLVILGGACLKPSVRLTAIGLLGLRFLWLGSSYYFAFTAGLLFAEMDTHHGLILPLPHKRGRRCTGIAMMVLLSLGLYLLAVPFDEKWSKGYWYPWALSLPTWTDWWIQIQNWQTIGAVLVVAALRGLPRVRAPLESKPVQFLGKVSFSLYLLHQTFYRTLQNRVLDAVCEVSWGKNFWWTKQDEGTERVLMMAWVVTTVVVGMSLLTASNYMAKHVDQRSVTLAHRFEKMLSRY